MYSAGAKGGRGGGEIFRKLAEILYGASRGKGNGSVLAKKTNFGALYERGGTGVPQDQQQAIKNLYRTGA